MIVSHNYYYARPGNAEAVLRQRLRACDVREKIGLPRGRVLQKIEGVTELPDVMWEIEFDDTSGHHIDMAARAASPEFEAIRHGMRLLYRRFERPLYASCAADVSSSVAGEISQPIVLINIFCDATESAAVLDAARKHAASLPQQGKDPGRVLQLVTEQRDIPQLIWQISARDAPMPADLEHLNRASARLEYSVWRTTGSG